MPNVNLDKVIASLILAIEDSHDIESLTELKKDYLKNFIGYVCD